MHVINSELRYCNTIPKF